MRIILATASPTRQEICQKLGIPFELFITHINEEIKPDESLGDSVERLAMEKSASAFAEFANEADVLVIAFDSLVALDGKTLGKPQDEKEALKWFKNYKGKKVEAFSGVGITGNKDGEYFHTSFLEKSWIHFNDDYNEQMINDFLSFGDWKGKAGAITVEGAGAWLVKKIEGDFPNVLGVPIIRLGQELRALELEPLDIFKR